MDCPLCHEVERPDQKSQPPNSHVDNGYLLSPEGHVAWGTPRCDAHEDYLTALGVKNNRKELSRRKKGLR